MRDALARSAAVALIRKEVAVGEWVPADLLIKRGLRAGISPRTLRRTAREELGVEIRKDGYQGPWLWRLPDDSQQAPASSESVARDDVPRREVRNAVAQSAVGREAVGTWPHALPHPTALGPREHLHYMNGDRAALCGQRALLPDDGRAAPWCTMCLHAAGHKPGDTLRIETLRRELQGAA